MNNDRRMNVPGTPSGNWGFTLSAKEFAELKNFAPLLRKLVNETGR